MKKRIYRVVLFLLISSFLTSTLNFPSVKASGTIYIRADGSVDPPSAPITRVGNVYTLTDDITDSIVVEKDNIVIDGAGHIVEGPGSGNGIDLSSRSNVTIRNMRIRAFDFGIFLSSSSVNMIQGNNIIDSDIGIGLFSSSNNILIENTLISDYNGSILLYSNCSSNVIGANNIEDNGNGISLQDSCNYNVIFRNTIRATDAFGIYLRTSSYNNLTGNDIRDNYGGVGFESCSDNLVFNNNFANNSLQVSLLESVDFWNMSYPVCGNYWSDYNGTDLYSGVYQNETGSDGIGDTAYILQAENIDHYPLIYPWVLDLAAQNHMIVAFSYSPSALDPATSYDTASGELIMNVYETLIFFDEEKTNQFVPRLATNWEISADGLTYTLTIRQGVRFHNNETLTTEDVEYSFERLMVIDELGGPAWMFYEPLFDTFGSRDPEGGLIITGQQIDDAITRNETAVTLHLTKPYPPFMQILAQAWSSVLCKKWCVEIGDWPGTWNNWTLYNRPYKTAIENQTAEPPGPHINAMCGTGPFMFDYYQTGVEWSIVKFDDYWGGWPAPGSNGFLQRVTGKTISNWEVRKNMFLEGQLDHINVPTTAIDEVLGQPGVRYIYPLNGLVCSAMFFTFDISTSSPYLGVPGGLPIGTFNQSGIPPNFFSDINVRKGFAYAFNYSKLIAEELRGEAYQPATPIIPGLPFHNAAQERYSIDLDRATDYFVGAWGGQVWNNGFNFTICYSEGNLIRQKAAEITKANVESLNPKFHIQIQPIPFVNYSYSTRNNEQPIFIYGWLADFADPHNFVYGFMYSEGAFAPMQLYSNATIDSLTRAGIGTMDEPTRRQIYNELQSLYHIECPSVPLYQSIGRRFERDWVRGWYNNPLLWLMNYFYVQWKGSMPTSTRYSWPMFRHDSRHTGYTEIPAPRTNQTLWNFTTGNCVQSSLAIAEGKAYAMTLFGDVYCLDALSGVHVWNFSTGGFTNSSCSVVDGRVYLGGGDGRVYCLDALTGARIWNYTIGVFSSPTVSEGRVYVGSGDNRIYCLDAFTGSHIWNFTTGNSVHSSPAFVEGRVYVGSYDGKIYCLDALSGVHVWNFSTGSYVVSSPAVVDGRLYVGSNDSRVYCLNAFNGEPIWNYTTGGPVRSSPAITEGKLYVGSGDGKIYCLDALTGLRIWNFTTGGPVYSSPAVAFDKLYAGSYDKNIYCLDALTGAHIWNYITGGIVYSSPAVADNMLFVGSCDDVIYAFGDVINVPENYGTIQAAVDAAAPNSTIVIAPGIYNESIVVNKTLTIIGWPGSAPIFQGGGSGIAITLLPGASGSVIAGIVITHYDQGIVIAGATNCKIYDTTMSLMKSNGITMQGSSTANNLIYCNIFEDNTAAINLTESSTGNVVYKNIVTMNNIGVNVGSSGNVIYANNIAGNDVGINLDGSSNNLIFHNNLVDNTLQLSVSSSPGNIWDDGYPSGGNYWSSHTGTDENCSAGQNVIGSDGIIDTNYTIAVDNVDRYPLLQPFSMNDLGITNVWPSKTVVGQGRILRLEVRILNFGLLNDTLAVTLWANETAVCQQTFTLTRRNCTNVILEWNTTGFARAYIIKANLSMVQDDDDMFDNSFTYGIAKVSCIGDINGDYVTDAKDFVLVKKAIPSMPSSPNWNANADLNDDGVVDAKDYQIVKKHIPSHLP